MRRSRRRAGTISDQSAPTASQRSDEGVGVGHRPEEVEVDRGLGQLGALVAHRQDRAAEAARGPASSSAGSGRPGSAAPTMMRSGLRNRSHRVAEDQGLDPVVDARSRIRAAGLDPRGERAGGARATPGSSEPGWTLGGGAGSRLRSGGGRSAEVAPVVGVGRDVPRDDHEIALRERGGIAREAHAVRGPPRRAPGARARAPAARPRLEPLHRLAVEVHRDDAGSERGPADARDDPEMGEAEEARRPAAHAPPSRGAAAAACDGAGQPQVVLARGHTGRRPAPRSAGCRRPRWGRGRAPSRGSRPARRWDGAGAGSPARSRPTW